MGGAFWLMSGPGINIYKMRCMHLKVSHKKLGCLQTQAKQITAETSGFLC